jgi:phage tail sheath protein FI
LKIIPFSEKDTDIRSRGVKDADKGFEGGTLVENDYTTGPHLEDKKWGLFALEKTDLFNLLCIPPDVRSSDTPQGVYATAETYCKKRRALLIVDPLVAWGKNRSTAASDALKGLPGLTLTGVDGTNAAIYFPRVQQTDPMSENQVDVFAPCGIVAGIMARTDTQRGVWKAPAGLDASLTGIVGFQVNLNDAENGMLNPMGINVLRDFGILGKVVWGARTLRGADQFADQWKYIPVRRTALFIEESLFRGLQWVVFEPNDEPLWAQIRLNVGAFMHSLFIQGAFQGTTPRDAYFVKCDKETTTQDDINKGIVNIVVGFAPLKPAEFVVIKLQQMAGQIQT